MNNTLSEVIKILGEKKEYLYINFNVSKIGIFGSAVREEINTQSDIDFVVEFERDRGGFKDFGGLIEFLENLFKRKVDILTPWGIKDIRIKSIKETIEKELEYV